uniref:Uncharacterized protein n=1 Tax=Larimichthys crocea TaxID=215358 RepID=A0A0F8AMI2_LARCR
MEQRAKREKDRAEQEGKGGGWRARSKTKNSMERAEQEKRKWAKWAMWWQGVKDQQAAGKGTTPPEAEWVLLRVIKRKWSEPRWTSPFQVTERTTHAVRLKGKGDTWFHWSQCAAAEEPQRSLADVQRDLQDKSTESADSETDPAREGAE